MSSSRKNSSSGNAVLESPSLPALPQYVLEDIINRVDDARDVAKVQLLSKDWRDAGYNVRSLQIVCLDEYHERARNDTFDVKSLSAGFSAKSLISEGGAGPNVYLDEYHKRARDDTFDVKSLSAGFSAKSLISEGGAGPSTSGSSPAEFKKLVVQILKRRHFIVQLRIEVEAKLQSKSVQESERRLTDFWLTDPSFLNKWLPRMGGTLQHLCIVDYGQQAIMRRSKIVKILSETCKLLKTLDLRNMFIDTSDCEVMPSMASLTLRCVKVVPETLQHVNDNMRNLQTLALLGVFGAEGGALTFEFMKVLCLGLSTPAKDVVMECPRLEKLQLKMQCPQKLIITAQNLKYVAFNLDVMDPAKVELRSMVGLQELLYGATSFTTLSNLIEKNFKNLDMIFLDIPCMALAEDGRFLGVLKDISLQLPSFSRLHQCEKLEVLNIGPGLWYSMETQVRELLANDKWPSMRRLILQMIPHDMEAAIMVLRKLLRTSVTRLDVFIHTSSPMTQELMTLRIEEVVSSCEQNIKLKIDSWQKSLDFSCFSF